MVSRERAATSAEPMERSFERTNICAFRKYVFDKLIEEYL